MRVHVVVPQGVDDPEHPSGGNVYDRRVCKELVALGWAVHEHPVAGDWPTPAPVALAALSGILAAVPDHEVVLLDGLIASAAPDAVLPEVERLRVVVLLHMPIRDAPERAVLSAAAAVVTTSRWARRQVVEWHGVPERRVHVAEPGADVAARTAGSRSGAELLCLAAVVPPKGHDTLIDALARISHLDWRCRCVGAVDLDPAFVDGLRERARDAGIAERVVFTGPLTGSLLDEAFATTDLLVSASRRESYGMAVTEALARGIPVAASTVGGLTEAVGLAADSSRPGLLFPADEPHALAALLERWLGDAVLRQRLRRSAAGRRATLGSWARTAGQVADVLADVRVSC
ncbi:glycosyltransferase family 4 protein [Nocardioides sp. LHG3406-4]|uniref:glycosyltransferase family 4 protein n=1 Tax=Nocardioides sp. LHG3406-4 TaxID=2804575 RepID=UPI003CE9D6FA